ncbi:2-hydroxyacid dehydrogenase [Hyphomonas johnsonii]|uniref:Glyoxylate reductase n=1 Tax=Hyphomonas johnsonii MHS-2 TaxID=1280950 RepID=A0A059FLQ9_9PROT|nr:D-glycerate dehydrogenase [Hyphomonas johnsonii]KCZ91569.1 glyoxylate reductase [Hyphomonas johnsonii MHS-2]
MPVKKLKIVVTRKLPTPVELRMMELFDTRLNHDDHAFTHEELVEAVQTADVLVPTVTDRIDSKVLARAGEQLRLIAQFGAGVDNIDVQSAVQRGITVTNTPGVLTDDTADFAMALILAVPRRLHEGSRVMDQGLFDGWTPTWMMGRRLAGKRLGIIGMGRIGQAVARRAKAFGLQIHYHNRKPVSPRTEELLDATYWDSLDQMLARMDIVSINCPHTPATFHLMNARRIDLMKPESYIINTARGEVIDEAALARALKSGKIAGAGLDVFEREPAVNAELIGLPNVLLLPHMGSATIEGRTEMGEKVIINIKTFADGHRPPDRVIPAIL